MDPERWREIRSIFDQLVELGSSGQAERLAALESTDPELRRAVVALLQADAEADLRLARVTSVFAPQSAVPSDDAEIADALHIVGRTVSHFRIMEPLGAGGMGVVYAAEDIRLGRLVALKLPLSVHRLDSAAKKRFLQEARSIGALDHPNICSVYEAGESEEGQLYLAMACYRGETLKVRLAREGALPVPEAVSIARQVVQGLAAAHNAGIVHRDLKPANLMLLPSGEVKILDFGLAKIRDLSLTGSGTLLGTASYMSPEQIQRRSVDIRSDLWSLGVVLYEMLTGQPPFQGEHEVAVAHAIVHEEPVQPSKVRPGIPSALEIVTLTLLEKDSRNRYHTIQQVASDLDAILDNKPLPLRRSLAHRLGAVKRLMHSESARRTAIGVIGTLLLTALGLAGSRRLLRSPEGFDPNLLAVAPFDVPDSTLRLWREGLVDILSLDLDGAGPLRTVPQSVVLRRWSGRADQASAARLGIRTGAGIVAFGHLVRRGSDSVALRVALLDRSTNTTRRDVEVVGNEARMGELAASLGVEILRALGQGRPIASVRDATLGARSLTAVKEFLRGEQFYRHGRWDSALAHYHGAITLDSGFALGFRRLTQAAEWAVGTRAKYGAISDYRRRAIALNRGLSPRDSLMLVADSLTLAANEATGPAGLIGAWYGILAVLDEATRRFPEDPNLWNELGEALFHSPVPIGGSPAPILEKFERAIALDPGFGPAYEHVVELALRLRRPTLAAHYARTAAALVPPDEPSHLRLTSWILDSGVGTPGLAPVLLAASGDNLWNVGESLKWATDSGEAALAVLGQLAKGNYDEEPAGPLITDPLLRRRALASALAFRGRLSAAAELGAAPNVAASSARPAALVDPFLELALFGAVPDSVASRAFNGALAPDSNWSGPPIPRSGAPILQWPPRYLRGAPWWLARRDRSALGRLSARALRESRASGSPMSPLRGRYLYSTATAYLALLRGDSSRAIHTLEAIPDTLCVVVLCSYEKVTLARLLAARGQNRRAAEIIDRWAASSGATPSAVLAALERARIAERLSDTLTARDRYQFVVEVWRHADPKLQSYVTEARAALERLGR